MDYYQKLKNYNIAKTSAGWLWSYVKVGQVVTIIEKIFTKPNSIKEYIDFILDRFSDRECLKEAYYSDIISKWELNFINSLYDFSKISMTQKIRLVNIKWKLNKPKEIIKNPEYKFQL